jgi:hypothetical protein
LDGDREKQLAVETAVGFVKNGNCSMNDTAESPDSMSR